MSFKDYYNNQIKTKMMLDLKLNNPMQVPKCVKIVVNVGAGEAVSNKNVIQKIIEQINWR